MSAKLVPSPLGEPAFGVPPTEARSEAAWIPACAGMTSLRLSGKTFLTTTRRVIRQRLTFCVVHERRAGAADLVRVAGARAIRVPSPPESATRRDAGDDRF